MRPRSSRPSGRNTTISSTRFRNSGRNSARRCSSAASRICCTSAPGRPASRWISAEPMLDVMMMTAVPEVDRPPLAVGEPAVVEDLEQHVEDVVVRLLDLVEEDHRVGPAPHRLGELAALLVADVAGGRADQPRDGVLLHVLGHVEPHHGLLVVEEELGQRPRRLGLPDAGGAEEDERADGAVRVLQPGARAPHRRRDRLDRLLLPDHPLRAAAAPCRAASPPRPPAGATPGCRSTWRPPRRSPPASPPPSAWRRPTAARPGAPRRPSACASPRAAGRT